mmetsp:Transcript_15237/g.22808  ORF Transcript_15237/g.22808 Transcript_15237/m.22808 type:complete len:241 (-) Transcript_15237:3107-3829(-)
MASSSLKAPDGSLMLEFVFVPPLNFEKASLNFVVSCFEFVFCCGFVILLSSSFVFAGGAKEASISLSKAASAFFLPKGLIPVVRRPKESFLKSLPRFSFPKSNFFNSLSSPSCLSFPPKEILLKSKAFVSSGAAFSSVCFTLFLIPANALLIDFLSGDLRFFSSLRPSPLSSPFLTGISFSSAGESLSVVSLRADIKRSVKSSIRFSAMVSLVIELSNSFCMAIVVFLRAEALLNSFCSW